MTHSRYQHNIQTGPVRTASSEPRYIPDAFHAADFCLWGQVGRMHGAGRSLVGAGLLKGCGPAPVEVARRRFAARVSKVFSDLRHIGRTGRHYVTVRGTSLSSPKTHLAR